MHEPKIFIVGLDLFPYDCLVAVNKTPAEVQKQLRKFKKPLPPDLMAAMKAKKMNSAIYMFNDVHRTSVIYILSDNNKRSVSLFDHEKMHFLNHVLTGQVGLKLNDETEEAFAYASEYAMRQFLFALFPEWN